MSTSAITYTSFRSLIYGIGSGIVVVVIVVIVVVAEESPLLLFLFLLLNNKSIILVYFLLDKVFSKVTQQVIYCRSYPIPFLYDFNLLAALRIYDPGILIMQDFSDGLCIRSDLLSDRYCAANLKKAFEGSLFSLINISSSLKPSPGLADRNGNRYQYSVQLDVHRVVFP